MKKYILFIFGNITTKLSYQILQSITDICESSFIKFKLHEHYFLIHFSTTLSKGDLEYLIIQNLFGESDSFFLVENNDNLSVHMMDGDEDNFLSLESENKNKNELQIKPESNINDEVEFFIKYFDELNKTEFESDDDIEDDELLRKSLKKNISLNYVLDKINENGIDSLTQDEKNYLKKLSN